MLIAAFLAFQLHQLHAVPRIERLVALAHLDAAVRYFDPVVATRASSWDSLFAANAVRIADAPTAAEYARLITAMMKALHPDVPPSGSPQRALVYEGFPSFAIQSSGGYRVRWRAAGARDTYRVDMGEGVRIDVPMSEASADTTESLLPLVPPSSPEWRAAFPSAGYRILAAARIWSTIRLFYPYKSLIGENWDDQFRAALPAFESAHDAVEYAQAAARFASHIHDSHVTVSSNALFRWIGIVPVGAAARLIENQLVITRIADSSAERAGLRVGDVVMSIDGEPTPQRIARLTPFYAVSTPQSLRDRLQSVLLNGRDTTPARLVVRGPTGGDRTLLVPRSIAFARLFQKQRTGNIIRVLPGNIGYIDLDRLPPSMVDSAFRVLADTKAIVLDDRGYPLGTAWAIAPRLNTHRESTVGAKFERLIVPSADTTRTTVFSFDQPIPTAGNVAKYAGRTALLIDERTISQAEHTGLFFESANGTTFIGSPSVGANGDITTFAIPGGMLISFTGHDVRHADGRQLQRVGLQPQVVVMPTVAGIRAGRDEVLEAAVKYLGGTGEIPPDTVHEVPVVATSSPAEPMVPGWGGGSGVKANAYHVGLDVTVAHSGSSSGHIAATSSSPEGFGSITQLIKADNYRGKRVRYTAYIKTRGINAGGAGLWMRVDGNGAVLAFDNMQNRAIAGTSDWTRVSIVLDVPTEAAGIAFGMLMTGPGDAWVDDASLEIVDTGVATTNMMSTSTAAEDPEQTRRMYSYARFAPANLGFEPK